ncbi:MAG: hypothetical protein V7707_08175 [Motiliproteus sp.]
MAEPSALVKLAPVLMTLLLFVLSLIIAWQAFLFRRINTNSRQMALLELKVAERYATKDDVLSGFKRLEDRLDNLFQELRNH